MRARPAPALLASLAVVPAAAGCAPSDPAASGRPRHILLVTVDTLRTDRLGCYGNAPSPSPNLDRLAREGTLFRKAFAPRGQTWPALTTLLTGLQPATHGVRRNGVRPDPSLSLLPERLRAAGYRTRAFLANFGDAFDDPREHGFERLVRGDLVGGTQHAQDVAVTLQAERALAADADAPAFTWVHYMDPHRPYDPPRADVPEPASGDGWLGAALSRERLEKLAREGRLGISPERLRAFWELPHWRKQPRRTYGELAESQGGVLRFDQLLDFIALEGVPLGPADLAYVRARYDAQVRATDRLIGRLLERVDALGLRDETLVLFASDHGDELHDHHAYFFHGASIYDGVLSVPLIARWPGRIASGVERAQVVELADVAPTVLDLLGLGAPPAVEGVSLWPLLAGGRQDPVKPYAVHEIFLPPRDGGPAAPPLDAVYAIRDARWKLVSNASGAHPSYPPYTSVEGRGFPIARAELYDLELDPQERRDLLHADPGELAFPTAAELARYALAAAEAHGRLRAELAARLAARRPASTPASRPALDAQALARLEALGYVEGVPGGAADDGADEPSLAPLLDRALRRLDDEGGASRETGTLRRRLEEERARQGSGD